MTLNTSTNGSSITTTMVNHHRIKLMSVHFHHSGYVDRHIEIMHRTIEKHTNSGKKNIQIVGGDFNGELGPGSGVERVRVGPHTLKEVYKRGDWMKQSLMMQNFTAFNTMYKNAWKANDLQIAQRSRETNWLHFDQEKTLEIK